MVTRPSVTSKFVLTAFPSNGKLCAVSSSKLFRCQTVMGLSGAAIESNEYMSVEARLCAEELPFGDAAVPILGKLRERNMPSSDLLTLNVGI